MICGKFEMFSYVEVFKIMVFSTFCQQYSEGLAKC